MRRTTRSRWWRLRGAVRLHLNTDRSGLHRGVDAHDNQTYVVRLRFAGGGGGWHWDETLRVEAGVPPPATTATTRSSARASCSRPART